MVRLIVAGDRVDHGIGFFKLTCLPRKCTSVATAEGVAGLCQAVFAGAGAKGRRSSMTDGFHLSCC